MLRRLGLHARKSLGQHFLVDPSALDDSISAAEVSRQDLIIEVGPGLGVLTRRLAERAGQVVAVELDSQLASFLERRFRKSANVSIVNADILTADAPSLLRERLGTDVTEYKVVANLPYYAASPIIRRFLEMPLKPRRMVVMIQKEVAESMCAAEGKMSLLSVGVQLYGVPRIVRRLGPAAFYPPPKVESAIVRIDVHDHPAVDADMGAFFRTVKAGFSAPRKQLRNALAQGLDIGPEAAAALLERAGISRQRRAETLSLEEWARLSSIVSRAPDATGQG